MRQSKYDLPTEPEMGIDLVSISENGKVLHRFHRASHGVWVEVNPTSALIWSWPNLLGAYGPLFPTVCDGPHPSPYVQPGEVPAWRYPMAEHRELPQRVQLTDEQLVACTCGSPAEHTSACARWHRTTAAQLGATQPAANLSLPAPCGANDGDGTVCIAPAGHDGPHIDELTED